MIEDTGNEPVWLLVSDIDDTLTGNKAALEGLWQILKAHRKHVRVALNSSRPASSVDATLASYFPEGFEAAALITGLGTQIRADGAWLQTWSAQFADWPDEVIREEVVAMGFQKHPEIFQTPGKASFAVPGAEAADRVLRRLKDAGFRFSHIYSGTSDLDILAPGAGKDAAMRHLADHFAIPAERTVAAGDSGNDLALFNAAGRAIAVGNARDELVSAMPKEKTYHATACHAAGVMEGLIAFGVIPDPRKNA